MLDVGLSMVELAIAGATGTIVLVVIGLLGLGKYADKQAEEQLATDGGMATLREPDLKDPTFGTAQRLYRMHRRYRKRRKLAKKGYVEWYLVDGTYPDPKYVKPEYEGSGELEYKHDGNRYLFDRDMMLPNATNGMWTAIHREGEAEPVNLRDGNPFALRADELQDYLDKSWSREKPGWLGSMDIETDDLIKYGMLAIIGWAVLQQVMGGGLF